MNSSDSWSFFDRIYCISIDDRHDRRDEAKKQFAKVGLLDRVEFIIVKKHSTSPEEGCYQSHIDCLKRAIAANAKYILIFEDDIIFKGYNDSIITEAACFLEENSEWNVIFLGCIVRKSSKTTHRSVVKIKYQCLSHAYAINRQFAETIVSKPWQGIPYDAFLAQMNKHCYAIYPSFAFQSNAATDNRFFIDKVRRIFGGLSFIQKANEIFQRHKALIISTHLVIIAVLLFCILQYF